jgi:hypothetical protein
VVVSAEDGVAVETIFEAAPVSPRRPQAARTPSGVVSADRKPGTKLPERLARKRKQQEQRAVPMATQRPPPTKTPASEPALRTIAESDSDDPFA